jgi:hypothetical protein
VRVSVTFRNRTAIVIWIFAATWVGGFAMMMYVILRDGGIPGYSTPVTALICAFFGTGGLILIAHATSTAIHVVTVHPRSHVVAISRYPHRTVRDSMPVVRMTPAYVEHSQDNDGDPYYRTKVVIADKTIDLVEGNDLATCEAARDRFNRALG